MIFSFCISSQTRFASDCKAEVSFRTGSPVRQPGSSAFVKDLATLSNRFATRPLSKSLVTDIRVPLCVYKVTPFSFKPTSGKYRLKMSGYVLALDQGTTSTRAILFDARGNPICKYQTEFSQIYPRAGWVEHDPVEILESANECINECMREASEKHSITPEQVKAVGITNQRETTVIWDRGTGQPLHNAIVWLDTRTHSTCEHLRETHDSERIRRISGLPISTYFSGVKLRWMIDNVPEVAAAIDNGSAMFGTIDTWLVWNLSREKAHVTDVTNAGRTMLMNIETLQWDDELLDIIGVKRNILPGIRSCSEVYGHMAETLLKDIPIAGLIGDQQGALVGQTCFEVGQAKNTYGTGCFLIVNTGTEPKRSRTGLLTTPAYKFGDGECIYSLEGSVAIGGAAVTWLRDGLGTINSASEVEALASSVKDTGDVYFVPAFSGFLAPYWREDARGTIVGMTQYTTKAHIARAVLESITFQVNAVLQAASRDMGNEIVQLRVDGGASVNNLLLQTQADITGSSVVRPTVTETTALGAAFAAGHAVGLFQDTQAFTQHWEAETTFNATIADEQRRMKLMKWDRAVQRSFGWIVDEGEADVQHSGILSQLLSNHGLALVSIGVAIGSIATAAACRFMKH